MKLKLPSGEEIKLPDFDSLKQRLTLVNELISKHDEIIMDNMDSSQVKFFLNGCSNYILWFIDKEDKRGDNSIIHRKKSIKMNGYDKNNIPFTDLSMEELIKYGIEDSLEY